MPKNESHVQPPIVVIRANLDRVAVPKHSSISDSWTSYPTHRSPTYLMPNIRGRRQPLLRLDRACAGRTKASIRGRLRCKATIITKISQEWSLIRWCLSLCYPVCPFNRSGWTGRDRWRILSPPVSDTFVWMDSVRQSHETHLDSPARVHRARKRTTGIIASLIRIRPVMSVFLVSEQ